MHRLTIAAAVIASSCYFTGQVDDYLDAGAGEDYTTPAWSSVIGTCAPSYVGAQTWGGENPGACSSQDIDLSFSTSGRLEQAEGAACEFRVFDGVEPGQPGCEQYFACGGCLYLLRLNAGLSLWEIAVTQGDCDFTQYCVFQAF